MPESGFVAKLFDFSFSEFVSITVVKYLYILGLVGAALTSIVVGLSGFANGFFAGIGTLLVLAPLTFAIMALSARVSAELVVVLFRIGESSSRIAVNTASVDTAAPASRASVGS